MTLVEFRYPALSTSSKVRKWIDAQMGELGVQETPAGAWLAVDEAIEDLMRHVGVFPAADGKVYVQVMADAVRVYRKAAFCTVGVRALQGRVVCNSMCTTMTLL